MSRPTPAYATLDAWIAGEAMPFSLEAPDTVNAAADAMMARLGAEVDVLDFGETLHGAEELFILRNRLFQRLVEAQGIGQPDAGTLEGI